jgi:hypothetical protein
MKLQEHLAAVVRLIRGWLPKETIATGSHGAARPWWWKPMWGISLVGIVVVALVEYFYQEVFLGTVLEGVALTVVLLGASYYIRVRPNLTVNRAIWLFFGFSTIGFLLFAAEAIAMMPFVSIGSLPDPFALPATVAPFVIGIYLGNWVGKKRNYRLPLSP